MVTEEITDKLLSFIQENLLSENEDIELDETTPLLELGVLDSLKTAILLNYIRNELGANVPPQDLNASNFKDVRSVAGLIRDLAITSSS